MILKELTAPLSLIAIWPCTYRIELESPEPKQWAGDLPRSMVCQGPRVPVGRRVGETGVPN